MIFNNPNNPSKMYATICFEYKDVRLEVYQDPQHNLFAVTRPVTEDWTFLFNPEIDIAYPIPKFFTYKELFNYLGYRCRLQSTYFLQCKPRRKHEWAHSDWMYRYQMQRFLRYHIVRSDISVINIFRMPLSMVYSIPDEEHNYCALNMPSQVDTRSNNPAPMSIEQHDLKFRDYLATCNKNKLNRMIRRTDLLRVFGFDIIHYANIFQLRDILHRKYMFGIFVVLLKRLPADVMRYIGTFFDMDEHFYISYRDHYKDLIKKRYGYTIDEIGYKIDEKICYYPPIMSRRAKYAVKQLEFTEEVKNEIIAKMKIICEGANSDLTTNIF